MTVTAEMQKIAALKRAIDYRLNEMLCGMTPEHDDSVYGFNEAWSIVNEAFDVALPAPLPKGNVGEAVAWRVVTNNTAWSFYRTREEAEHGANNRLTYVKGCTSAVVEPLYAAPPKPVAEVDALLATIERVRGYFKVEYSKTGSRPSISYGNDALPEVVALLDAALAAASQRSQP